TATWALNTLVAKGKTTDWMVHMLGQAAAAHTDATHGMTLAAVTMPYYKFILPYGVEKFARYAINVWNVNPQGKMQMQIAEEGLETMEKWMRKIGLVMNLTQLGATQEMLDGMVKSTLVMDGGYKVLSESDIRAILQASF
ncbi:MAG: iron-containing alcohol dehydrogenase, partial [Clostridia bacterium]|nr:iron-containing alcohol dehydrogenase [Clostridia bacterium]